MPTTLYSISDPPLLDAKHLYHIRLLSDEIVRLRKELAQAEEDWAAEHREVELLDVGLDQILLRLLSRLKELDF